MSVEQAYRLVSDGRLDEARAGLQHAAEKGDAQSALELGVWYLEGRLVPRDLAMARSCFQRAGNLGNVAGKNVHIAFLANGIGGPGNWREALQLLRKLSEIDAKAARQIALLEAMDIGADGQPGSAMEGQRISDSPAAWTFDRFFTADECRYLMDAAIPLLQPSVVVDPATGQFRPHPVRTSHGASFPWAAEDLVISALNRRIAMASGTDVSQGEPLQVLRYSVGQEYRPHFDALPPGDNQRIWTMLVYLNGGYEGGETFFNRSGLKFAGRMGDALLFRNAADSGEPDENSQHAGLPILSGEKFVASRWIRQKRFGPS